MRLFVPLTRDEFDRLRELASDERRRPQDQAAVLLGEALGGVKRVSSPPESESGQVVQTADRETASV